MASLEDELIVEQIQIGPMQNFTYLVGSKSTREVVIIDPAWDIPALTNMINEAGYTLTGALVTHYHPDHCGGSFGKNTVQGVADLLETNPVKIFAHRKAATAGWHGTHKRGHWHVAARARQMVSWR